MSYALVCSLFVKDVSTGLQGNFPSFKLAQIKKKK